MISHKINYNFILFTGPIILLSHFEMLNRTISTLAHRKNTKISTPHPDRTGQKRATVQSGRSREYGGEFPGGRSP
jgi:hypothetical protein